MLFDPFESIVLFLSVIMVNSTLSDARSNWLEGFLLMSVCELKSHDCSDSLETDGPCLITCRHYHRGRPVVYVANSRSQISDDHELTHSLLQTTPAPTR